MNYSFYEIALVSAVALVWIFAVPISDDAWSVHVLIFVIGAGWLAVWNKHAEQRKARKEQ